MTANNREGGHLTEVHVNFDALADKYSEYVTDNGSEFVIDMGDGTKRHIAKKNLIPTADHPKGMPFDQYIERVISEIKKGGGKEIEVE